MDASDSTTPLKHCNKCNDNKPPTPEFWHRDKKSPDGFTYTCKDCVKRKTHQWLAENRERNKENCPGTVAENIVPACRQCNGSKHNHDAVTWLRTRLPDDELMEVLGRIAAYFDTIA